MVKEFSVFVESMRRLYMDNKVDTKKILELFESEKISEEEKWHILNARKDS